MGPRKRGVNGCLPLAAWSTPKSIVEQNHTRYAKVVILV